MKPASDQSFYDPHTAPLPASLVDAARKEPVVDLAMIDLEDIVPRLWIWGSDEQAQGAAQVLECRREVMTRLIEYKRWRDVEIPLAETEIEEHQEKKAIETREWMSRRIDAVIRRYELRIAEGTERMRQVELEIKLYLASLRRDQTDGV